VTTPRRRFCCDEDLASLGVDGLHAAADLARWRADRLSPVTRELIEAVRVRGVAGTRVLDIGAGVGAVHVALLEAGAGEAIDVDASKEFLAVARAEAERRGLGGRVDYRYGDLVEVADDLPAVDIVTLDSVICCYPYLEPMLASATRSRPRLVGITYPRDTWWMRAYMRLYNGWQVMVRRPGRYAIHRHPRLERWMADAGYHPVHDGGIRIWRVLVYERSSATP
jgi:SAM-dependent methyltransferase